MDWKALHVKSSAVQVMVNILLFLSVLLLRSSAFVTLNRTLYLWNAGAESLCHFINCFYEFA